MKFLAPKEPNFCAMPPAPWNWRRSCRHGADPRVCPASNLAPSNVEDFKTGAGVYEHLVLPSRISLEQVAAHYAMSSLFTDYCRDQAIYCYIVRQQDYRRQRLGPLSLAVGRGRDHFQHYPRGSAAGLRRSAFRRLGLPLLHSQFPFRLEYTRAKDELFATLSEASAAQTILAINRIFGSHSYSLQDLFAEERHRIMRLLSQDTLLRLDQLYSQVYRDNYGVLRAFHRDGLAVPQELQVAADIALSQRTLEVLQAIEQATSDPDCNPLTIGEEYFIELDAIATEASYFHARLSLPEAKPMLEGLIWRAVLQVLSQTSSDSLTTDIDWLERLILLGERLSLGLSLERPQELYYQHLNRHVLPWLTRELDNGKPLTLEKRAETLEVLRLGEVLAVDVAAIKAVLEQQT
jgi:hypothetical protein